MIDIDQHYNGITIDYFPYGPDDTGTRLSVQKRLNPDFKIERATISLGSYNYILPEMTNNLVIWSVALASLALQLDSLIQKKDDFRRKIVVEQQALTFEVRFAGEESIGDDD